MLDRLNTHRDWANGLYVDWYLSLPEGDAYCLKMLTHILLAEEAWLGRIFGHSYRNTWGPALSPEEIGSLPRQHRAAWEGVLAGSAGALTEIIRYKRFDGTPDSSALVDILTHACTHGMYHRGQIAAYAARTFPDGPKIPPTDFIVFSRLSQLH
jgi:uncharacterized damage-inducible protein DinB